MFFVFPRMAELLRWVKEDLREDESLLLFGHQSRVQQIAGAADRISAWIIMCDIRYTHGFPGSWGHYIYVIFNPQQEIRHLQNAMEKLGRNRHLISKVILYFH